MRAGAKARSTKQQARIHRFNDLEADVKQQQTQDKGELNLAYSRLGKQVYELDSLTKIINGRTLFQDITQIIQSGQRIGIVGPNGAGKQRCSIYLAAKINNLRDVKDRTDC